MKRPLIPATIAAAAMLLTSCGSKPAPTPTVGSGSEVDRSSAEATAVAFATIYATGDVPAACELANDQGKEQIGRKCDAPQPWSTSVTLSGECQVRPNLEGAEARSYRFNAPEGSLNRNSKLELHVEKEPNDSMWWVTLAITPMTGPGASSSCLDTTSSSANSAPTG